MKKVNKVRTKMMRRSLSIYRAYLSGVCYRTSELAQLNCRSSLDLSPSQILNLILILILLSIGIHAFF